MPDAPVADLFKQVGELSVRLNPGPSQRPRYELELFSLFDRCRSLFGAIRTLLARRFIHEALMLSRPLFTDSLVLDELAASDETRRIELVMGMELAALADFEGVMKEAARSGDDTSTQIEAIAKRRAQLREAANRHGVTQKQWRPDEKQLAAAHTRDGYLDFRIAHHFVHGSMFALAERYTPIADGGQVVAVGGPAVEESWAPAAALSAAESLLHACRAFSRIIGSSEPPEFQRLLKEINEAGDALSSS